MEHTPGNHTRLARLHRFLQAATAAAGFSLMCSRQALADDGPYDNINTYGAATLADRDQPTFPMFDRAKQRLSEGHAAEA